MTADQDVPEITWPMAGADPGPMIEHAWAAFHAGDWDEAGRRWAVLRAHFPEILIGYSAAVTTLREAGRLDEAAKMAAETIGRFPNEPAAHSEAVWLTAARGKHADAAAGWAAIRDRFPGEWVGYFGGARALRDLGDAASAEAMLAAGAAKFPREPVLLTEYASAAAQRQDWHEAARRWADVRRNAPQHPGGYTGGAQAARELGRHDEAETLLRQAIQRFPADPSVAIEYAWIAHNRHDWPEANLRWAAVRAGFPHHQNGYTNGAQALREAKRFDEADALLSEAAARFPDDTAPLTELAWTAFIRSEFPESARRWETVRTRFPALISGYLDAVHPLRRLNRLSDAEQILIQAVLRFPDQPGPAIELASLSLARRDWGQAERLYAALRERFPDHIGSYGGGIQALRELQRFEEAEAVTEAALERFPRDHGLRIDLAWLAQNARDWKAAIERWAAVRVQTPDFLEAYIQGARVLSEAWRDDEAEALLGEAMRRLPNAPEPLAQHAWLALHQNRFDEAEGRFRQVRERFPDAADGWRGGAIVARNQFRFGDADALLAQAITRFPDDPQLLLEHAQLPVAPHFAHEKDWPETLRRLDRLHAAFPSFEAGFIAAVRALNDNGQADKAEALARSASQRLSGSYALATQYAEAAEDRQDWPEAIARYSGVRTRFPDLPGGELGLARALAGDGRFDEAEAMLQEAMERFPAHPSPFAEFAEFATRQQKWAEALKRWTVAVERFPQEKHFAHRQFDARLRLADADPLAAAAMAQLVPAPMPDPNSTDQQVTALVMQFESLGGRGLGCEFGIFQRDCGAEPLGLLRWADMPYDLLVKTLRNSFEGVGSEEHTELFVSAVSGGRGEYCTRDRRGMMFMRAFVYEDQATFEEMKTSALNRLRFLTRELIADLEEGTKIFVFRLTDRNLTTAEIDDLHDAMRAYGDNMLLYVRYEDETHSNGTVELVKPGLMIGYMDRFKLSPADQLSAAPPTASWLAVCRNAYALWRDAA